MLITLTLPAPCPPLNANQRLHWAIKAKYTAAWRARAHVAAIQAGRPKLERAHITAVIHPITRRTRDIGNYYPTVKAAIDGITESGVLPDDDDKHVVGPDLRPGVRTAVFTLTITLDDSCGCRDCAERWAA